MEKEKRKRSPDERKRKSTTSDDDEDVRRRSKKSSRDRGDSKDKSKHKKHKSSRSKEKSHDKHKGSSHKHTTGQPSQEISVDDYFAKSKEFATWLKEEKRLFFNDLSSESARNLFSSFVKRWNANKLDPRYYEGITVAPRTSHVWNFKKEE